MAIPRGRGNMVGEFVMVRLLKATAEISGEFEFNSDFFSDPRTLYIPVFVRDDSTPVQVLARTHMEVEVPGYRTMLPEPCPPPPDVDLPPGLPRIVWFSTSFEFLTDDDLSDPPARIHVRYSQPLIDGKFYYLPIITGVDAAAVEPRDTRYRMHLRAGKRIPRLLSQDTEFDVKADRLVVYLKHHELVVAE